jgi:hypothetical protein
MQAADIRECVEIVAAHPVIGPRYQGALDDLRVAWLRLLDYEAKSQFVFEEVEEGRVRLLGAAASVFVGDDFIRWMKTPPLSWIGPELAKRIARDESPALSRKQLEEANSRGGLNLICWETCVKLEDAVRPEVYNKVLSTFMDAHRGYLWKEITGIQAETAGMFYGQLKSGGMLLNPTTGQWEDSFDGAPEEIVKQPHFIGLSREIAMRTPGSLVGLLFDFKPPRFGLSASAQRLLLAALRGGTDEELADELGISLSAVKKAWRSVYERVAAELPDLIPASDAAEDGASERTREKKRPLLTYLREHPEELRPVSRKLIKQTANRN